MTKPLRDLLRGSSSGRVLRRRRRSLPRHEVAALSTTVGSLLRACSRLPESVPRWGPVEVWMQLQGQAPPAAQEQGGPLGVLS